MGGKYQRRHSGFHGNKMCAGRIPRGKGVRKARGFIREKMMRKESVEVFQRKLMLSYNGL